MENTKQMPLLRVYLVCIGGMVIGSFISPLIKLLINLGVDSTVITFYRMLFVSLLVVPVLFSKKENRQKVFSMSKKTFLLLVGYSITKTVGMLSWAEAINQGASAFIVNTLGNIQTVFVVVFAWFFLKEKISKKSMLGIAVCLVGVGVIGLDNMDAGSTSGLAIIIILVSALFNAGNTVFGRAVRKGLDLLPLLGVDYMLCTIFNGAYCVFNGSDFGLSWKAILYLLLLSWFCTLLCHSVPIWALRYVRPASVSVINLAGPFVTAATGFLILNEVPNKMMYLGAAIMACGLGYYVTQEQKEALAAKEE